MRSVRSLRSKDKGYSSSNSSKSRGKRTNTVVYGPDDLEYGFVIDSALDKQDEIFKRGFSCVVSEFIPVHKSRENPEGFSGIAEASGNVHIGDYVTALNGVSTEHMSVYDIKAKFKEMERPLCIEFHSAKVNKAEKLEHINNSSNKLAEVNKMISDAIAKDKELTTIKEGLGKEIIEIKDQLKGAAQEIKKYKKQENESLSQLQEKVVDETKKKKICLSQMKAARREAATYNEKKLFAQYAIIGINQALKCQGYKSEKNVQDLQEESGLIDKAIRTIMSARKHLKKCEEYSKKFVQNESTSKTDFEQKDNFWVERSFAREMNSVQSLLNSADIQKCVSYGSKQHPRFKLIVSLVEIMRNNMNIISRR